MQYLLFMQYFIFHAKIVICPLILFVTCNWILAWIAWYAMKFLHGQVNWCITKIACLAWCNNWQIIALIVSFMQICACMNWFLCNNVKNLASKAVYAIKLLHKNQFMQAQICTTEIFFCSVDIMGLLNVNFIYGNS